MPDSWLDTLAFWLFPDSWNSTVPLGMSARPANRTADSRFTSSAQILNSSGQRENKQFETVPPCWLNFRLQFPYGWIIRQWHWFLIGASQFFPQTSSSNLFLLFQFSSFPAAHLCCWCARMVSHVILGFCISGRGSLQASMTRRDPLPEKALVSVEGRGKPSPLCLSWRSPVKNTEWPWGRWRSRGKRKLLSPNYNQLIVKGKTCGEGSGSAVPWWFASPILLLLACREH